MEKEPKRKRTRSQQREYIISKLYQMDLTGNYEFKPTNSAFVNETLNGVIANLDSIDALLEDCLSNWHLNRLSYVDRAILRLAAYEMGYTKTAYEIVIDEALNLTHKFSDEGDKKHVAFNNRVLETLAHKMKKKA